jgi:predicted DNA-binding WGR domain protein
MASTSDQVHSWSVEYAKSNRSKCQACKEVIEMGAVRVGMEVDNPHVPGKTMFLWHKAGPLFDLFRKGSENKARIKAVSDMAGFGGLRAEDREELEELVRAEAAFREGLSEAEEDTERFEHEKGVFWSIVVAGSTTRVKWGKNGEDAVLSEKNHADEAAAEKFKDKMVRAKRVLAPAGEGAQLRTLVRFAFSFVLFGDPREGQHCCFACARQLTLVGPCIRVSLVVPSLCTQIKEKLGKGYVKV